MPRTLKTPLSCMSNEGDSTLGLAAIPESRFRIARNRTIFAVINRKEPHQGALKHFIESLHLLNAAEPFSCPVVNDGERKSPEFFSRQRFSVAK